MTRRPLRSLLERRVLLNGIALGFATDALVDVEAQRVVGFDVACGDNALRFVPFGAARVVPRALEVDSALILLEEDDQAFYRKRSRSFRSLLGTTVERDDVPAGDLVDLFVAEDGAVAAVVVATELGSHEVPASAALTLDGVARESAA